jgi:hypothetical protein
LEGGFKEPTEERGGDLEGEVADHLLESREGNAEDISHHQLRVWKLLAKILRQPRILLDGHHVPRVFQEAPREHSQARSNFEDGLSRLDFGKGDDGVGRVFA